jgi:DNA-directed RNA polymerase subunit RPC12/RpoP
MKVSKLNELGLRAKTLDNIEVSVADVITDDEFNRPGGTDYRNEAISRLVDLKVSFSSNCNIVWEMMKRFVRVECPYCGGKTKASGGGGNGHASSMEYVCEKCDSKVILSVFNDGVSLIPAKAGRKKD